MNKSLIRGNRQPATLNHGEVVAAIVDSRGLYVTDALPSFKGRRYTRKPTQRLTDE